jgi:hypothetical protein
MTTPESLARTFVERACIPRAELPPDVFDAPDACLRPAWEAYFAELGMTPSEAFLALLDASSTHYLDFGGWGVLDPEGSRYHQSLVRQSPSPLPVDAVYGAMVPLFCCDGDLLLLDRDGSVFAYMHDGDSEAEPPVAPTFEALLQTLLDVLDGRAAYPLDLHARALARRVAMAP